MPAKASGSTMFERLSVVVRVLTGLVVLGLAIGLFMLLRTTRTLPPRTATGTSVPIVQVIEAVPVPIARTWSGYGTARSMDAIDVPALVAGRIESRPSSVEDGAPVVRGTLLVQIEKHDFEQRVLELTQRVAAIQAQLDGLEFDATRFAEQAALADEEVTIQSRQLQRVQDAIERSSGNLQEVDVRWAAVKRAARTAAEAHRKVDLVPTRRASLDAQLVAERAALARANRDLLRTTITAPITGRLQRVAYEADEWVPVGATVARIVGLEHIEVPLSLPVSAADDARVGDRVAMRADGPLESNWAGTIARIAPEADNTTRSMTVFVEVTQDPLTAAHLMLPGQFVVGSVSSAQTEPRIIVPRSAVLDDHVMLLASTPGPDGPIYRTVRTPVVVAYHIEGSYPSIDPLEQQWAVIEQGIEPGDRVIVSGLENPVVGARVELAPQRSAIQGGSP